MNCIHGIDSRFCAACNKPTKSKSRTGSTSVSLEETLRFLNEEQTRATYGAVAELVGVIPRSLGALLGPRRPEASWIVNTSNGLPTDYSEAEWHPQLLSRGEVITTGKLLALRIAVWRGAQKR